MIDYKKNLLFILVFISGFILFTVYSYTAEKMIYLGEFYPTCAYSDEVIHMYLATGLTKGEQNLDDDEFVGVESMPLEQAVKEIMNGNITDGKTQTAILKAYLYLKNE